MQSKLSLLLLCSSLALAACGGSGGQAAGGGKGPNSEARTTAFKQMMPDFTSMGKMVKDEEPYDVEKFKTAAASFDALSKEPFKHFAADGDGQNGDALPAVWSEPDKFQAEVDKFHAAVAVLTEKAQSGNLADIKVAYGDVGASCKSCHDSFRRPK